MARLALLAALLVAFAPSVSRVLTHGAAQAVAGWTQMCTSVGLAMVVTEGVLPDKKSPAPAGMPPGDACAYCALAAALPIVLLFLYALVPTTPGCRDPLPVAPRLRILVNQRGLGSQGPPILL